MTGCVRIDILSVWGNLSLWIDQRRSQAFYHDYDYLDGVARPLGAQAVIPMSRICERFK